MDKMERVKNQNEALEHLMKLHEENPELPIIPMVDGDVVGDTSASCGWMGRWGRACIKKLFAGNQQVHEYDDEPDGLEIFSATEDFFYTSAELDLAAEDGEYAMGLYRKLPWTECIVVYIDTP